MVNIFCFYNYCNECIFNEDIDETQPQRIDLILKEKYNVEASLTLYFETKSRFLICSMAK